MLHLWIAFGFLLDDLIKDRVRGALMLQTLSASNSVLAKSLLRDSWLVDGWVATFVDPRLSPSSVSPFGEFTGIDLRTSASTMLILVSILGTWVAAAHASMLATVAVGARRYLYKSPAGSPRVWPYYVLPLVPYFFLVASHLKFAYGGSNRNSLQPIVAALAVIFFALLVWLSLIIDSRKSPSTLRCTKRHREVRVRGDGLSDAGREGRVRIALIGDSLSTDFHVAHWHDIAYRLWFSWRANWFNGDRKETPVIEGVVDKVANRTALTARNCATATAKVAWPRRRTLVDWIMNSFHMEHQIDELLGDTFPDIVLIWIGHNNVDWVSQRGSGDLPSLARSFGEQYRIQLERLALMAAGSGKPVTIVVFALVNFEAFFKARKEAEEQRSQNPSLYPHLETDYRFFASMRPENRKKMIELANLCNRELESICPTVDRATPNSIKIELSWAMARANISAASLLHGVDAWHPSRQGHCMLAEEAWNAIEPHIARAQKEAARSAAPRAM
jgi:hypothetical protein